jgi:prepilin peptidase CpaA
MANELTVPPVPALGLASPQNDDSLGIDRAFVVSMARIPFFAVLWTAAAWVGFLVWDAAQSPNLPNLGSLVVLCIGMILAAIIDGWAFKVPNWLTLSIVMSGWYLGILHDLGYAVDGGAGGFGSAILGTALGFALLFPMLFIQGMGQGDVKMQMGFGSWVAAFFGISVGSTIILTAFCIGAIIGGVFGLVMMALRRQFYKNAENFKAIMVDLQTLVTDGHSQAADRANARRPSWVRLPYGVPLCVGFVGYLAYRVMGM